MTDAETIEGRRRVLAILDQLRRVGLITYFFAPPDIEGPEPHLEVWADRDALNRSAWGLAVSTEAARIWDALRAGTFSVAASMAAIQNVLNAGGR